MKKPVYYSQKDPRWGSKIYANAKDKTPETIGASGCGPTCMAMILAEWLDPKITPADTCSLAVSLGDRTDNDGTEWEYFTHVASKYGLKFKQTGSITDVITELGNGALVVCSMGPGYFTKGGHYILAYDIVNGEILVNDPASTTRVKASLDIFKREAKQYFCFRKIDEYGEAIQTISAKIGIDVNYWKGRKNIDPYFATLMIKVSKNLK